MGAMKRSRREWIALAIAFGLGCLVGGLVVRSLTPTAKVETRLSSGGVDGKPD